MLFSLHLKYTGPSMTLLYTVRVYDQQLQQADSNE